METLESHAAKVTNACNVIRSTTEHLKQLRLANPGVIHPNKGNDANHAMDVDIQIAPNLQLEVEETAAQGQAIVQNLRFLNRDVQHEERKLRNALTDLKTSVGQVDLGLQNLRYQRKYLLNEIARCHDFETYYQDVDLVPIEEFKASAPSTLSDVTDDHQLMLNRLQFELDERKRFDLEKRKLLAIKTQLAKANKSQKAHITKIEKQLEDYVAASAPIQELLLNSLTTTATTTSSSATTTGSKPQHDTKNSTLAANTLESAPMRLATTELLKRNDLAQFLPEPLYVLYRHATAFSSTFGDEVRAEIHDLRTAAQTDIKMDEVDHQTKDTILTPMNVKSKTAEDEDAIGQHNRRGSTDRAEHIYERAPFDVVIKIKKDATPTSNTIMHLRFGYLVRLGVVVVKVEGAPGILKLDCSQILHELFPGDFGEVCPNPEAAFLGLDAFGALVSSDERSGEPGSDIVLNIQEAGGYAYRWAQEICGLEYLGPYAQGWGGGGGAHGAVNGGGARAGRRAFLSQIVRLIRNRRRAWKALERQMEDLDRGVISRPRPRPVAPSTSSTSSTTSSFSSSSATAAAAAASSTTTANLLHDEDNINTLFATLKDGLAKSNLVLRGWRAVEGHDIRHALVYRVTFDQKLGRNTRTATETSLAMNGLPTSSQTFVEGTVEIYLAYPDRAPQWELKPGPAFPEEPAVTTTDKDKDKDVSKEASSTVEFVDSPGVPLSSSKDGSPGVLDDENVEGARRKGAMMEDMVMEEEEEEGTRTGATTSICVSPQEQLRILQMSVNNDLAGALHNADPYEHNLLISIQVAKIQLGLDAILEEPSSQ
ncbi:THO complex subunit 5 [Actinomortierella ambigua]|uniref:THO complex subunit 5 n=1 Tax=Actinomortierella ambigua TaxID=1343610 RepID=A0A9P6Q6V8_9FUNG|nr:THO complex subunit 5 [Actinomortierella ambigua]